MLETRYQRAFADRAYPEGVADRLKTLGLLTPRLTLAHCVYARDEDLDRIAAAGAVIATNPSSNLHLASGVAPIGEAIRRGCRVALGVDASALDEDDDIVARDAARAFPARRLGLRDASSRAATGSRASSPTAASPTARRATGALEVGAPADILILDLDRLDRDAVMPVEPVDLVFARATAAHVETLIVAGREVVRDGRLVNLDLEATEAALRQDYRAKIGARAAIPRRLARSRAGGRSALPRRPRLLLGQDVSASDRMAQPAPAGVGPVSSARFCPDPDSFDPVRRLFRSC